MNLVNLFGNKTKTVEPEYYLAIEIHESLIKTALWGVTEGTPAIVNIGSYESWADEESLINGVDASLEQAVRAINAQPRKVIFGLPDTWIEDGKIHASKNRLLNRLVKELELSPIGMVPINSAIAHYMKKLEGIPPTAILLEIYTTKVVVSVIKQGEITSSEEAARSGDIAQDVEEGLTTISDENFPSRFILTNGGNLEEEEQRITSHPWQERLSFQHMPKVEVLPVDFSIKAIALTGGLEAIEYNNSGVAKDDSSDDNSALPKEESNIVVPQNTPSSITDLGFTYEETTAPESVEKDITPEPQAVSDEPEYAFTADAQDAEVTPPQVEETPVSKPQFALTLPKVPKFSFPKFTKGKPSLLYLLAAPALLLLGFIAYLIFGEAEILISFKPQKITSQFTIAIAESSVSGIPTLLASKKVVSGNTQDSIETSGEATVGDKASGTITIANKSVSPITLKAGATILSENGKYAYSLNDAVTIASKSADPLTFQETYGKATGVGVTASKIGADYNLSKNTTFSVDNYSRSVAYAVADTDFSGGTSRAVRAVSKADQDKLLQTATDKIKAQVQQSTQAQTPGFSSLVLSDFAITKKTFDKNVGEEATNLNLSLEGSTETLVYSDDSLYQLVSTEIASQIPAGSEIFQGNTAIKLATPSLVDKVYQAKVDVEASIFPIIDEEKYKSFVKGKQVSGIRPLFTTIQGFDHLNVRISPAIPVYTKILPLSKIKFSLVAN
ncbi:MAG TPA: hypothetical protein PLI45_02820 [Candidatus Woesebacteria bacterium]|nr:hypothetical protein [Candidatus Woesebacteria bacterium]